MNEREKQTAAPPQNEIHEVLTQAARLAEEKVEAEPANAEAKELLNRVNRAKSWSAVA